MGYTFELWALSIDQLVEEITTPSLTPDDVHGCIPKRIEDTWGELCEQTSNLVASGGGNCSTDVALYVHGVIRSLGTHYGVLDHTSSGGEEFRDRFMQMVASRVLGANVIDDLLDRPIAGLVWPAYPSIGWITAGEMSLAVGKLEQSVAQDPDDEEPLYTLTRAVERAAKLQVDLVSVYG